MAEIFKSFDLPNSKERVDLLHYKAFHLWDGMKKVKSAKKKYPNIPEDMILLLQAIRVNDEVKDVDWLANMDVQDYGYLLDVVSCQFISIPE
jgi:hypothetical protein